MRRSRPSSRRFGFVPNGGRVYYERRSQPPFLPLMVGSYYQATEDKEFLRSLGCSGTFRNKIRGIQTLASRIKKNHPLPSVFREALPALEREYRFWMQNRSVSLERNGKTHVMNRYNVQVNFPRYV